MRMLIRHPYVLFQHFKNTSLPTNVYLDDFCPITASTRLTEQPEMAGNAAKKQDMQPHASPIFYRLSYKVLMYLLYLNEQTVSLHQTLCRHTAKVPLPLLSSSQTYNILSPPPPSSLIYILIHRKRDLLWWQCSHIFTLRAISPCLKFTEAGSEIFHKTLHSLQNRISLRSSLPIKCRLFIVYYCRRIFIAYFASKFHQQKLFLSFLLFPHWPLKSWKVQLCCVAILSHLAENRFNNAFWPNAIWQAVEEQLVKPQIYSPCLFHSSGQFYSFYI